MCLYGWRENWFLCVCIKTIINFIDGSSFTLVCDLFWRLFAHSTMLKVQKIRFIVRRASKSLFEQKKFLLETFNDGAKKYEVSWTESHHALIVSRQKNEVAKQPPSLNLHETCTFLIFRVPKRENISLKRVYSSRKNVQLYYYLLDIKKIQKDLRWSCKQQTAFGMFRRKKRKELQMILLFSFFFFSPRAPRTVNTYEYLWWNWKTRAQKQKPSIVDCSSN